MALKSELLVFFLMYWNNSDSQSILILIGIGFSKTFNHHFVELPSLMGYPPILNYLIEFEYDSA